MHNFKSFVLIIFFPFYRKKCSQLSLKVPHALAAAHAAGNTTLQNRNFLKFCTGKINLKELLRLKYHPYCLAAQYNGYCVYPVAVLTAPSKPTFLRMRVKTILGYILYIQTVFTSVIMYLNFSLTLHSNFAPPKSSDLVLDASSSPNNHRMQNLPLNLPHSASDWYTLLVMRSSLKSLLKNLLFPTS